MNPNTDAAAAPVSPHKKPRLAFAIATVLGVGYAPKAPGTFGSLVGLIVAIASDPLCLILLMTGSLLPALGVDVHIHTIPIFWLSVPIVAFLAVAVVGVWSASEAAKFAGIEDPQYVVVDEVSGQHLTLLLALFPVGLHAEIGRAPDLMGQSMYFALSLLNWKYLLAGFVLFRLFDIAKPFPCRQLEKLPAGWGIMADDWMAGIYAALLLRLALHFRVL
jgi:phosphatidylglycerophosphatase A